MPFRGAVLGITLFVVVGCLYFSSRLLVKEDVRELLPSSPPALAEQFSLLSAAPFMHYTIITVSDHGNDPVPLLRNLETSLTAAGLVTLKGPSPSLLTPHMLAQGLDYLPSLLPENVYAQRLYDHIFIQGKATLTRDAAMLHSLKSLPWREVIAKDPFALYSLMEKSLQRLRPMNNSLMREGYVVSADGVYGMLMVAPSSHMTDSIGATQTMKVLNQAITALPGNPEVLITGGHRHTHENASTIRTDLARVLPLSLGCIVVLFFLFLRSWKALFLLPLPIAALAVASATTGMVFNAVSGIVLGFGGVLLGITTDYAVHVYYATTGTDGIPEHNLQAIAKPLCLAAATTMTAFAVLGTSTIPVISQLAVFSISGLCFALFFSLFILPHIWRMPLFSGVTTKQDAPQCPIVSAKPLLLAGLWGALLAGSVYLALSTPISGDIRTLGYSSASTRHDEQRTREIWGHAADGNLLVSTGETLEAALEKNDAVFSLLAGTSVGDAVTSLSPIWPSLQMQQHRHALWRAFWQYNSADVQEFLTIQGEQAGFSPEAFLSFASFVAMDPPFITRTVLEQYGLHMLPAMLSTTTSHGAAVYTIIQGNEQIPSSLQLSLQELGAHIVSAEKFRAALAEASRADIIQFGLLAFSLLALLTIILFRSLSMAALALLPAGTSFIAILCFSRAFNVPLNLFHIIALPLIMGLSVDYGIFMVHRHSREKNTQKAVALSALTTIATFGCLVLADHPALFSLGCTVFLGMNVSLLTALFVIPFLEQQESACR